MIQLDKSSLSPDLSEKISNLEEEVNQFREGAPLDANAVEKLREHFRTHHIYHSSGIEGNRLTLQETSLVLKEGIDISGKPLKDSIEVKNLGKAFDFLYGLLDIETPITENYIKQVHSIIVGEEEKLSPGEYRNIGVIISGAEHRPPEPFEVPFQMMELFDWIKQNESTNPIVIGAIAHHEFVKIHPFKDGNGRTARLLLNLILLKNGYPICNISREERPAYYEALSKADKGDYEPIIEMIATSCTKLFAEYIRVRDESNRMQNWAKELAQKDAQLRLSKMKTEYELWLNRVNQIKLEFKQGALMLDEHLPSFNVSFYEYPQITFERYQELKLKGISSSTHFFSVRFSNSDTNRIIETLMFRFYRSNNKYPLAPKSVPLELNYFDSDDKEFRFIGHAPFAKKISLRSFYLSEDSKLIVRQVDANAPNPNFENDTYDITLSEAVQAFYEQIVGVLQHY